MCCFMCGILFCSCDVDTATITSSALSRRGPDAISKHCVPACPEFGVPSLTFCGCVLHHRGPQVTRQPIVSDHGSVLLWNGEVFEGLATLSEDNEENDGVVLLRALESAMDKEEEDRRSLAVVRLFEKVRGPFAFIFYDQRCHRLYFGRDFLGRRSLLAGLDAAGRLCLASVTTGAALPMTNLTEVPCLGLFSADLTAAQPDLDLFPFDFQRGWPPLSDLSQLAGHRVVQRPEWQLRSVLPALISDQEAEEVTVDPPNNVTGPVEEDEVPNLPSLATEEQKVAAVRLLELLTDAVATRVLLTPPRCADCNPVLRSGTSGEGDGRCAHARVAVLFSGGLDSTVLAVLAHRVLPLGVPIDLLNVAFEHPGRRSDQSCLSRRGRDSRGGRCHHQGHMLVDTSHRGAAADNGRFSVPDRATGSAAVAELQLLCPGRHWRLVRVDVPVSELQEERQRRIAGVLQPATSVLDDSLGCAVWFAARGLGECSDTGLERYRSPARLLLLGMGADEQLAGYSRHRTAFHRGGWPALGAELAAEVRRLGTRNLGRDDRAVADHGREARFPFLDESVVAFLAAAPARVKASLWLRRGVGEKLLLRLVAWRLGLRGAAVAPKRAMQFGTRIAKAEGGGGERGHQTCQRLLEAAGEG